MRCADEFRLPHAAVDLIDGAPRLAVSRTGAGPLLVCLHGVGGNRANWDDQLAAFAEHFTVVAWDARGYGHSDDYDAPLRFEDFSNDLARLLDHYDVERAHLLGISMGGRIAIDFGMRWPHRVATLVAADTSIGSRTIGDRNRVEQFLARRKTPLLRGQSPADIAADVADSLLGPDCSAAVRRKVIDSLSILHKQSYLKTLDAVTTHTPVGAWTSIAAPALVLVGEHDRIAPMEDARELASLLRAELVLIKQAGHMSNMENPAAFNAAVLDFLLPHRAQAHAPFQRRT